MDRTIDIYMPGFAKPLSQWSVRALELMGVDLLEQRAASRTEAERKDVDSRIMILQAESQRRGIGIGADVVRQLRDRGADRPFATRQHEEKQLTLPLEGGRDRGGRQLSSDRSLSSKGLPPPDRAERGGEGRER